MNKYLKATIAAALYVIFVLIAVGTYYTCSISEAHAENLRGFHVAMNGIGTDNIRQDIRDKAAMGANIARMQLWTGHGNYKYSVEKQTRYYESVNYWKQIVWDVQPTLAETNTKYILDFHDRPCGKYFDKNPNCRAILLNAIITATREFKDDPLCYGVDVNELKINNLRTFYQDLITAINQTAPNMRILVEPYGGNPDFIWQLDGLIGNHIVPSIHDYGEGEITHYGLSQWGIKDSRNTKYQYGGKKFNKKKRRERLQRVRNFELSHPQYEGVFVGENGITRVSVDKNNVSNVVPFLNDVFDLYNEWGWDATYLEYKSHGNVSDMWDVLFKGKKQKDHSSYPRNEVFSVFEKFFN